MYPITPPTFLPSIAASMFPKLSNALINKSILPEQSDKIKTV